MLRACIFIPAFYHLIKCVTYRDATKEEGKDQESIQSSISPDPGHHMGKCKKHKKILHTRAKRLAFSAGDHKAAMNRQDSTTDMKHK